jgi:N-methylhydantoinase B
MRTTAPGQSVDPITAEVIRGYLLSTLHAISTRVIRSGRSPNITERRDVSTAILDARGRTVAQFEMAPLHLGELISTGQFLFDRYPLEKIHPGDAFIANDCYTGGGTHLPDVTIATPVFHGGELVMLIGNLAHQLDIGGRPGAGAGGGVTIYEEGIRIPVTKIVERGVLREDVLDLITLNCRMPDQRRADWLAQIAANDLGAAELVRLCDRYGREVVLAACEEMQRYASRLVRTRLAEIPDGRYEFVDYMEDDGAGTEMIPVQVALEVSGEHLHVDFTGTGPQVDGNINLVAHGTIGCVLYALRAALDPTIPPATGFMDAVTVTIPEGTLLNPRPPAGCNARIDTCQRVAGVMLGAFAKALPGRLGAGSCDSCFVYTFAGVNPRDEEYFTYVEAFGGGSGARPTKDGLDAVQVHMANIANFPIEVAEAQFPIEFLAHRLREDSGGPGQFRGGLGECRELRILAPGVLMGVHSDGARRRAWGSEGGSGGHPGGFWRNPGTATERQLPSKFGRYRLDEGDVIRLLSPSGGGYGRIEERDRTAVLTDVVNGRVSPGAAGPDYGLPDDETGPAAELART